MSAAIEQAPFERVLVGTHGERPDFLVHALAQLPDEVLLALPTDLPQRPLLELLARAYGIDDRLEFGSRAGRAVASRPPRTFAELVESLGEPTDGPASLREEHDALLAGQRVAVVTNFPTHYRVPLLNEVGRRLAAAGASFRVFFLASGDPAREWMRPAALTFEHEFLSMRGPVGARRRFALPVDLDVRLGAFTPTLVLAAGFSPVVAGRTARFAARARVPLGLWSGETAAAPTATSRLRRLQRVALARRASFGVVYGFAAGEYLRGLVPALPFVYARNTTPSHPRVVDSDNEFVEVLAVGRAVPEKGLDLLVDAFSHLRGMRCRLTIAGEGPELDDLRRRANGNPAVRFLGALPSDRVHDELSRADVFAFPSRFDHFGLVGVEAMGAGLPMVVARHPGMTGDLAVDGRNCLVVEDPSPGAWASAVCRVVENDTLRDELGRAAARTIANRWTIAHSADALIAGFRLGVLVRGHA